MVDTIEVIIFLHNYVLNFVIQENVIRVVVDKVKTVKMRLQVNVMGNELMF